jgi:hypothetical protein
VSGKGRRALGDQFRTRLGKHWCVYCGEIAETDEHFPPQSATPHGVIFPACKECNCFAGTEFHSDFEARAENVRQKIRAKYKRLIQTPHWSTGELNELGHGLRKYVRSWEEEKKRTERRLVWDVKSYLALIDRHGELTKACERMARIVAEQKEKERLRFKLGPTVAEVDMAMRRRGRRKKAGQLSHKRQIS